MILSSDLLLLAMLLKFFWELRDNSSLPWQWFAVGVGALPFFLGLGGKVASQTLRVMKDVAGLALFLMLLSIQGVQGMYFLLLGLAFVFYTCGRVLRHPAAVIVIVSLVLLFFIGVLRLRTG